MFKSGKQYGMRTRAIHAGEGPDPVTGASAPNLVMSTTFVLEEAWLLLTVGTWPYRHYSFVPVISTKVGFTLLVSNCSLCSSSSGGGLFGRLWIRKEPGALLIWGLFFG